MAPGEPPLPPASAGMRGQLPPDFASHFDELAALAYRVAFRIVGQREDARDIAQEALARAFARWRRVHAYAPAWVSRVAANLALDVVRRRPREAVGGVERGRGVEHDDHSLAVVARRELVDLLEGLPRRQREVVVLRYLADLSEADVARVLGCANGTVKRHASRGLAALRAQLGPGAGPDLSIPLPLEGTS